ncbi:MAG: transglutaminase-like domain-containing protein, partial [Petrotogales bacterium]
RKLELKKTMQDVVEIPQLVDYMNGEEWNVQPGQTSIYQQFVTPTDSIVQEISKGIIPQQAYELAVDWVWVSDSILHKQPEKWLFPSQFLSETSSYPTNPVYGNIVSDCSEQANTLTSILRASGVSAENVRVVIGEVNFDGNSGGHAWVEIKEDGKWMVLDPTCGPFYDEENKVLKSRNGVNYYYWKYHPYPVEDIWVYYNDVYFTDENKEVASGWSTPYGVFTDADIYAGLISEGSFGLIFIFLAIFVVAIISFIPFQQIKRRGCDKK